MIVLLLPLRWMFYQGAPVPAVYGDAPEERYVWAPPEVRTSEAVPIDPEVHVDPVAGLTVAEDVRFSSSGEESRAAVVPLDFRTSGA